MDLPSELIELLGAFGEAGVRYLLVGGHAVAAHGRPRATKDVDLWLASDPENRARAAEALAKFGVPSDIRDALLTAGPTDIVWFGRPPLRVDLLQSISGVEFEPCWARRVGIKLEQLEVPVISRDDLVANELASGRPQDRRDARALAPKKISEVARRPRKRK